MVQQELQHAGLVKTIPGSQIDLQPRLVFAIRRTTSSGHLTRGVPTLQIGIVLSTAAILAVAMPLFWASVITGAIGTGLFLFGYLAV